MNAVVLLNAAKMIWNWAWQVSACNAAGGRWALLFVGVGSFGSESDVRTAWLLAMVETTSDEAVDIVIFVARSWLLILVIASKSS